METDQIDFTPIPLLQRDKFLSNLSVNQDEIIKYDKPNLKLTIKNIIQTPDSDYSIIDSLNCLSCNFIATNPLECTDCNHIYCKLCVDTLKINNQSCKECNKPQFQERKINKRLEKILFNQLFKCGYEKCQEVSSYSEALIHLQKCERKPVQCQFQCGGYFDKSQLEQHEILQCKNSVFECQECSQEFQLNKMTQIEIETALSHDCMAFLRESTKRAKQIEKDKEKMIHENKKLKEQYENSKEQEKQFKNQLLETQSKLKETQKEHLETKISLIDKKVENFEVKILFRQAFQNQSDLTRANLFRESIRLPSQAHDQIDDSFDLKLDKVLPNPSFYKKFKKRMLSPLPMQRESFINNNSKMRNLSPVNRLPSIEGPNFGRESIIRASMISLQLADEIRDKKEAWFFEVSVTDPNFRNAIMLKFGRAFIRMNSQRQKELNSFYRECLENEIEQIKWKKGLESNATSVDKYEYEQYIELPKGRAFFEQYDQESSQKKLVYRFLHKGKVAWGARIDLPAFSSLWIKYPKESLIKWQGLWLKQYDPEQEEEIEQFYKNLLYKPTFKRRLLNLSSSQKGQNVTLKLNQQCPIRFECFFTQRNIEWLSERNVALLSLDQLL